MIVVYPHQAWGEKYIYIYICGLGSARTHTNEVKKKKTKDARPVDDRSAQTKQEVKKKERKDARPAEDRSAHEEWGKKKCVVGWYMLVVGLNTYVKGNKYDVGSIENHTKEQNEVGGKCER